MTLIARAKFGRFCFYIGDLLLTGERNSGRPVDLPVARDINSLLPQAASRRVTGTAQKLNRVSERLIIGWAGSLVQARPMLRDFATLSASGKLTCLDDVRDAIERVPWRDRDDLSLIGSFCSADANGIGLHITDFTYEAVDYTRPNEQITIAGTGQDALIDLIPQIVTGNSPPYDSDTALYRWVEKAAFLVMGQFVGREMMLGDNLLRWWGGAI